MAHPMQHHTAQADVGVAESLHRTLIALSRLVRLALLLVNGTDLKQHPALANTVTGPVQKREQLFEGRTGGPEFTAGA